MRRDRQSPRNLSSFPERRTKRRLQGGPDRSGGSERLDNYRKLHTDPPVRSRATSSYESSKTIWIKREKERETSEPLLRFDPLYTRRYTRARARERERKRERARGEGGERKRERSACTPSRTVTGRLSWLLRKQTKERNEGTSALGGLAPLFMGHCICWPRVTLSRAEQTRPVWSHLTSDFAFDSLLANGSRISIRLPRPCLSLLYDMPRRTKPAVVQFFVAGDEYRGPGGRQAGRSAVACAIEIEIGIGIEVGWRAVVPGRGAAYARASSVRFPRAVAHLVLGKISGRTSTRALSAPKVAKWWSCAIWSWLFIYFSPYYYIFIICFFFFYQCN